MSNNMLDILKNFEDASAGKKPSAGVENSNEMKKILESFQSVEECGMEEMPMQPQSTSGQPVTVSVTASGKENVADLIALMQQAAGIEQPVNPISGGAGFDLDRDGNNDMEIEVPAKDQEMDMAAMRQIMAAGEEVEEDEDYINEPDEEYRDHNFMTKDLSGGINKRKKSYKAAEPGDNAMAVESIKDRLWAALNEKKSASGK